MRDVPSPTNMQNINKIFDDEFTVQEEDTVINYLCSKEAPGKSEICANRLTMS
jgi:hypothetical protein